MTNLPDEPDLVEILKGLSLEEQRQIRPVLERDLEFQRREKERLQKLRTDLDMEKSGLTNAQGSVYSISTSESQDSITSSNISSSASPSSPSRSCARCSTKLGFILNSGSKCKKCQQLVCDSCRVIPSDSKKIIYCSLCYKERELLAASREWIENTGDDVSESILLQLKRANRERSQSAKPVVPLRNSHHAPPISRRNMTLPSLETMATLSVPSEDEAIGRQLRGDITRRFWGGSPSPRSPSPRPGSTGLASIASSPPHSANSLLPEMHPREIIGSPAPRSSSSASFTRNFVSPSASPLPATEIVPPTPTSTSQSPLPEQRRRHVFTSKSDPLSRQYLRPIAQPRPQLQRQVEKHHIQAITSYVPSPVEEDPFEDWHRVKTCDSKRSISQTTLDCMDQLNNNRNNSIDHTTNTSPSHISQVYSCSEDIPCPKRQIYKSISRETYTSSVDAASQIDNTPRFLGEIQLHISYNSSISCLNIHIYQCRSLPHYGQHRPNPYIKIFVLGEYSTDMSVKYKTTARKSSIDPEFNEIIKVPNVNRNTLRSRRLLIGVWHRDALGHNAPIGETIIHLSRYDWECSRPSWYPIEAKASRIDLNPACYRLLVSLQIVFHLTDRERGLGHLTVCLHTIKWPAILPKTLYQTPICLQMKYYFNERRLLTVDSRHRHEISATTSETFLNWTADIKSQNINDLHLRSLKVSIRTQIGRFRYKSIATNIFNDYLHRKGRSIYHPCNCAFCQPWQDLINIHECYIELPFNIIKN